MRSQLDTLLDIAEMERCLQREAEVSYAKDFYVNLYEDAYRRVDADLKGSAKVVRLLVSGDRVKLVGALRDFVQSPV